MFSEDLNRLKVPDDFFLGLKNTCEYIWGGGGLWC